MKLSSQMVLQTYGILGPIDIRYTLAQEVALPGVKDKVRFASAYKSSYIMKISK